MFLGVQWCFSRRLYTTNPTTIRESFKMRSLIFFTLFACLVAMAWAESSNCPDGWTTMCSRDLDEFTVNRARRYCRRTLDGFVAKGQCITQPVDISGNGCCQLGR